MALHGIFDPDRTVIIMTGGDVRDVLQNIVTNDVDQVAPGRLVYAALLTPQGKYLFDFFLLDGAAFGWPEGSVLIDAPTGQAAALAQRLKMYCLRRDARIEGAAPLRVAMVWDDADAPSGDLPAGAICDPRDPAMGWRLYTNDEDLPGGVLPGAPQELHAIRIAHMVPQSGIELVSEDTYILEAGFERLSGVDFRKGCYVGQEVTARMKHKAELRKGLVRVQVDGDAPPGTEIRTGGKPAGTLFSVLDGQGLAHLRFDRAGEGMEAGAARVHYRAAPAAD